MRRLDDLNRDFMSAFSWRSLLDLIKKAVTCALLYAVVLGGGVFVLLVVTSAVGYLPYSDRPGPGWFSPHLPGLQELGFFGSWVFFFVGPFALLWGAILFVFIRVLGWLGAPKPLLRILGGLFAAALGLLGIASAGWYIAISSVGVYGGGVVGLLYGVFLLPRFAAIREQQRRWWQWVAIGSATLLLGAGIVYPLIPDRNAQQLEVSVMRLVPGPEDLPGENSGLSATEVSVLHSLGLRGELHGGIQSFSGGGDKKARALIVVRGPISSKVTLREPKAADVVYVQDGEHWKMYPANAPTIRKMITLTDAPGEYEGLIFAVEPVIGEPKAFTWYPPIKREQR